MLAAVISLGLSGAVCRSSITITLKMYRAQFSSSGGGSTSTDKWSVDPCCRRLLLLTLCAYGVGAGGSGGVGLEDGVIG